MIMQWQNHYALTALPSTAALDLLIDKKVAKGPIIIICFLVLTTQLNRVIYVICIFRWTLWKAKLEVQDAQHQHILTVNGPCCPCSCGSDVEFPVSLQHMLF